MTPKRLVLLALLLGAALLLSGCSKNSYVPCCVRDKVVNTSAGRLALLPSPGCSFPDGRYFGACDPVASAAALLNGSVICKPDAAAFCNPLGQSKCSMTAGCRWESGSCVVQTCASIKNDEECYKTFNCLWDNTTIPERCTGAGDAYWEMPVCVDDVPKSCVNNRCSAMACGITDFAPSPPPSSQDWTPEDPQSSTPTGDLDMLPALNLQGTVCKFSAMNRKLYNQMTKSRGALWVNSFRFGVGKSFSDFEQARNFFPATDRACSINPQGNIDRFTVYLNEPATWCAQTNSYFSCSKTGLNFTSQSTCLLYCEGDASDCASRSGPQFACRADSFAYYDKQLCRDRCSILDDSGACTQDQPSAPFLESDGRFRAKYVADYLVDSLDHYDTSDSEHSFDETCLRKGKVSGGVSVPYWDPYYTDDRFECDDFYPVRSWPNPADGPWHFSNSDPLTPMRTYFEARKSAQLDFDYEYYSRELSEQYPEPPYDRNRQLPFECKNSVECISGSCDITQYKRSLCINQSGIGTVDCGCGMERKGQSYTPTLVCKDLSPPSTYLVAERGALASGRHLATVPVNDMFTSDQEYGRTSSPRRVVFHYYSLKNSSQPEYKPKLFEKCGVPQNSTVAKCVFLDEIMVFGIRVPTGLVITDPASPSTCPQLSSGMQNFAVPQNYYYYEIEFNSNMQQLGTCNLTDGRTVSPYLKTQDLGWCAGCTYATLAVQAIKTGANPFPLRGDACYQWRGYYDYDADSGNSPYLRDADLNGEADASSRLVRKYLTDLDKDGNIQRGWFDGDDGAEFQCVDQWNTKFQPAEGRQGWWQEWAIPYPSAPYLREKLTSYLQSNVMPVLDVSQMASSVQYRTVPVPPDCQSTGPEWECTNAIFRWWNMNIYPSREECQRDCFAGVTSVPYTHYYPTNICTDFGGDGSAIYVVGATELLNRPAGPDTGSVYLDPISDTALIGYFLSTGGTYPLTGMQAPIIRADVMKKTCKTPPLIAMNINQSETLATLVGTGDLMDRNNAARGKLHKFFFKSDQLDFEWKVKNGKPDAYPGQVDLLLQEWYPACAGGGSLTERIGSEIAGRMAFSRALLSNFSKPSLIWRFHFPPTSQCGQGGHYGQFLDTLFNQTGAMVDAGIIGLIYDDWMTRDGRGYGPENQIVSSTMLDVGVRPPALTSETATVPTGLTGSLASGRLDDPATGKANTPFCELQRYSKKVLGITKYTYGQRLYAMNTTCVCAPCTQSDYLAGFCDKGATNSQTLPQLYCNDGTLCTMPTGYVNYKDYRCPSTCVNAVACQECSTYAPSVKSFCRIQDGDSAPQGFTKNYNEINDNYWEFVAGLPAEDKCCVVSQEPNKPPLEYTYASRSGTKRRSEMLQYPSRGEQGIDCGRNPDTSVLSYCNIRIPIQQQQIACYRVG